MKRWWGIRHARWLLLTARLYVVYSYATREALDYLREVKAGRA